jgi:hypothetical protein
MALRDSGQAPCGQVARLITERLNQIEQRLADLRSTRSVLRHFAHRAAALDPATCAEADICTILSGATASPRSVRATAGAGGPG